MNNINNIYNNELNYDIKDENICITKNILIFIKKKI